MVGAIRERFEALWLTASDRSRAALAARLASRLEERLAIMTGAGGVAARRRPPVEQAGRKTSAEHGSSSSSGASAVHLMAERFARRGVN